MILDIIQLGEPVLRKKCTPVEPNSPELEKLVADMLDTMNDAEGIGLAAPQVGKPIRLAIVDVSHDPECVTFFKVNGEDADMASHMPLIFINPELELSGVSETESEGCLSIQEIRAKVKRLSIVKATLTQIDGSVLTIESDGLLARAIQHETDHLNGVLFTDRISTTTKTRLRKKLKELANTKWVKRDE